MKLVFGVGINDLPKGTTYYREDGKVKIKKSYNTWKSMLQRCYDPKYHKRKPSYSNCEVSDEWKYASNFVKWYDENYVDGYHLDKDFAFVGNKLYSKETCAFIPPLINTFITDNHANRGEYPIGVCYNKKDNLFMSQCRNPFSNKGETLGYFDTPEEAHNAWKKRKHQHAIKLAETYNNLPDAVIERLLTIYK